MVGHWTVTVGVYVWYLAWLAVVAIALATDLFGFEESGASVSSDRPLVFGALLWSFTRRLLSLGIALVHVVDK